MIRRTATWPDGTTAIALFSEGERHRYLLSRTIPGTRQIDERRDPREMVAFLMLNPSTASETVTDPTVTRCAAFAKREGFWAFSVINLFSLRSTNPSALYSESEADGDPDNLTVIIQTAKVASLVICAWGVHGALRGRAADVVGVLNGFGLSSKLYCLGLTKDLHPKHPLYLPTGAAVTPFTGAAR